MNLQDFITESIVQISNGIINANKNMNSFEEADTANAIVNPRNVIPSSDKSKDFTYGYYNPEDEYRRAVSLIKFDVAIYASEEEGKKGGLGIRVAGIGIGGQKVKEVSQGTESRLQFQIPIVLPNPQKKD